MWDFSEAIDDFYLVYAVYARAETSMHAENLVIDDTGQAQIIEHVCEVVPYCRVAVLSAALGVEAIRLSDASAFVVAADQVNALRISEL